MKRIITAISLIFVLIFTAACTGNPKPIYLSDKTLFYEIKLQFSELPVTGIAEYEIIDMGTINDGKLIDFKFKSTDLDISQYNINDRLNIGYLYITENNVWKIPSTKENYEILKSGKLPANAIMICQETESGETLQENE